MSDSPVERRPVGRPSLYRPEYCDDIVAFCAQGYSITGFAGSIGVGRETISGWERKHPEFSVAVKRAKAAAAYAVEQSAHTIRTKGAPGAASATITIFQLKNFAPDEYRKRVENKLIGDPENPVVISEVSVLDQLRSRLAIATARLGTRDDPSESGGNAS